MNDLIGMIENVIGKKAKVKYIEKQKGDVKDTLADVSKARKELGWMPKVKIEEGLKRFTKWCKNTFSFSQKEKPVLKEKRLVSLVKFSF